MDPQSAIDLGRLVGAGLASIAMGGAAIGVGHIVGNFLSGALRNPAAAASQTGMLFVGIALAEALGLFAFVIAMILIFAT